MTLTTPSENVFNEMIRIATSIWMLYDNQFEYVTEKLDRVNSINNYEDNVMTVYRMFDSQNQLKFRDLASEDVLAYINDNL